MQRVVTGLVVVDGVTISMTSSNKVAKSDQQSVVAKFKAGVFPFFEVEGSGGWSNSVTFNNDGTFTAVSSAKSGNPQIIGVLVRSIDSSLQTFNNFLTPDFGEMTAVANAAACNTIPSRDIGRCIIQDIEHPDRSGVLPNVNCAACCAQRNGTTWINPVHVVAC